MIPRVSYLWDDLVGVDLLWGVQGSPLGVRRERELERRLWLRATPGDRGFRLGHPDDVAIYGAVQASRPGRPQRFEGEDLAAFLQGRPTGDVVVAARQVGLEAAVVRGLGVAGIVADQPPRSLPDRAGDLAWRSLRPKRLRGVVVSGTPRLGRAITRARFADREFVAGYGVFLPRAISESLVTGALDAIGDEPRPVVIDVGTGCGPVAISIAGADPRARVIGVDTSVRALAWARINRPLSMVRRVRFRRGSLLASVPADLHGRVTAITANVPYVPPSLWGTGWTSRRGTVVGAGEDGLDLYRTLVRQARRFLVPGGRLVFQLARMQWGPFREELEALGYRPGEEISGMPGDVVVWATWLGGDAGDRSDRAAR